MDKLEMVMHDKEKGESEEESIKNESSNLM